MFKAYELVVEPDATMGVVLSKILNAPAEQVQHLFEYGLHVSEAITEDIKTNITMPGSGFHGGPSFEPSALMLSRIQRF